MNRKEIIEGVKRKGSHGLIMSPNLSKPARDEIAAATAKFEADGGKVEQVPSLDEFSNTRKAAVNYTQN